MNSPLPSDPYEALRVSKDATVQAIKSAHRKLVLVTHPDKFPDPTLRAKKADEFHKIQQAYELLSDEARRAAYDDQVKLERLRRERYGDRVPPPTTRVEVRTAAPPRDYDRGYSSEPREHERERERERARERDREMRRERDRDMERDRERDRRHPGSYVEDDVDYFTSRNERPATSSRYDASDARYSSRRVDDRRAARAADDRYAKERIERERAKDAERAHMAEKKKTREKDRRKGRDEKFPHTVYYEEEDDSDRRRPRLFGEVPSRRSSTETSSRRHARSSDERLPKDATRRRTDDEILLQNERKMSDAKQHMERADRVVPVPGSSRPAAPHRSSTTATYVYTASPTPSSPVVEDTVRRSHARRGPERDRLRGTAKPSLGREDSYREPVEIVEPPLYESRPRPGMPTSSSSPTGIKLPRSMPQPQRAASMQYPSESGDPDIRPLNRASTSPMMETPTRRRESATLGSSKLRTSMGDGAIDPDYMSPKTPTYSPRTYLSSEPRSSTRARAARDILVEEDEFQDGADSGSESARSTSPHSRYPSEHARPPYPRGPSSSANHSYKTHVYAVDPNSSRRPSLRQESSSSSRVPPSIFRRESDSPARGSMPFLRKDSSNYGGPSYSNVQWTPKYRTEDISFNEELRRGPESVY